VLTLHPDHIGFRSRPRRNASLAAAMPPAVPGSRTRSPGVIVGHKGRSPWAYISREPEGWPGTVQTFDHERMAPSWASRTRSRCLDPGYRRHPPARERAAVGRISVLGELEAPRGRPRARNGYDDGTTVPVALTTRRLRLDPPIVVRGWSRATRAWKSCWPHSECRRRWEAPFSWLCRHEQRPRRQASYSEAVEHEAAFLASRTWAAQRVVVVGHNSKPNRPTRGAVRLAARLSRRCSYRLSTGTEMAGGSRPARAGDALSRQAELPAGREA